MRTLWVGALALLASTGCVVRHYHGHPAPPPPPPPAKHTTVTVQVGWSHVRYSIWAEYYGCSDEEIYYLENCGYDDDDLLALCFIARRARVPIRWVLWEYDRCGRSLYTVSLVYRLDPWVFYCTEVPRFHRAPPLYARAYGYYWRGERPFLTNEECHALVHLQIGVRYYGYTPAYYFEHYDHGVRRSDRHVFRTLAVRDYPRCGGGGRNVHETVVIKRERAWEARDIKDWEKKREAERAQVKIRHTPDHDRQEMEKARRAAEAEDRRRAFEEARRRSEIARREREESDKKHPVPHEPRTVNDSPGGPKRVDAPGRSDDKGADRIPPPNDGPRRPKGPAEPNGPPRADEDRGKPPSPKAQEPSRGPEKAPPSKSNEPRGPEKTPPAPKKAEDPRRGPEKAPPPPPKRESDRKPPPPPPKTEDRRGPEKPPPKESDSKKGPEKEKGKSRGR